MCAFDIFRIEKNSKKRANIASTTRFIFCFSPFWNDISFASSSNFACRALICSWRITTEKKRKRDTNLATGNDCNCFTQKRRQNKNWKPVPMMTAGSGASFSILAILGITTTTICFWEKKIGGKSNFFSFCAGTRWINSTSSSSSLVDWLTDWLLCVCYHSNWPLSASEQRKFIYFAVKLFLILLPFAAVVVADKRATSALISSNGGQDVVQFLLLLLLLLLLLIALKMPQLADQQLSILSFRSLFSLRLLHSSIVILIRKKENCRQGNKAE